MTDEETLVSMGYRQLKSTRTLWAKPIGGCLLVYAIERGEFTQFFRSYSTRETCTQFEELRVDHSKIKDLLHFLSFCERQVQPAKGGWSTEPWNWLDLDEQLSLGLH